MAALTAGAYLLLNSVLAASTQPHRCLGSWRNLSRLTVVKQSSAVAQQSIGAPGGMDAVQGEHPWSLWEEGAARTLLHPCRVFSWTRGLVALHELVHAVGLWMLLCRSAILGLG